MTEDVLGYVTSKAVGPVKRAGGTEIHTARDGSARGRPGRTEVDTVLGERFWSKVDRSGECWTWTAARTRDGYPRFYFDGRVQYAHRLAWAEVNGPIPEGIDLDHVRARGCTSKSCVRPEHLEPVTRQVNLLRGGGFAARNAQKTHCPKGHSYEEHGRVTDKNQRICRACNRIDALARYHRMKAR